MFKVNQELTIRNDLNELDDNQYDLVNDMIDYSGKKAKVIEVCSNKCYIDLDNGLWSWYSWCFEETR
jgi:hypothetical protein